MPKKTSQNGMPGPNAEEGVAFLNANKGKQGVVTLPSGLQYKIIEQGTGPKPGPADKVMVHYTGTLVNGKMFDSSSLYGQPVQLKVDGVIAGWTEALQLMPAGSKWELYIPSQLAYGTHTGQGSFPPNSAMVFEVQLLEIVK